MKTAHPFFRLTKQGKSFCLIILTASLLTGCLSSKPQFPKVVKVDTSPTVPQALTPLEIEKPVIRYNRYTLVEISATAAQKDLLAQIIDITIPTIAKPISVADAMVYVLRSSGYQLCTDKTMADFHRFQLPLSHHHLGPITVRDALSVLAGPAWELQVDQQARMVCFSSVIRTQEVQP